MRVVLIIIALLIALSFLLPDESDYDACISSGLSYATCEDHR